MARRQTHYVYDLRDADRAPLYVGCTWNVSLRLSAHARRDWWADVVHVSIEAFPARDLALAAEKSRIEELQPKYNEMFTDRMDTRKGWETRRAREAREAAEAAARAECIDFCEDYLDRFPTADDFADWAAAELLAAQEHAAVDGAA